MKANFGEKIYSTLEDAAIIYACLAFLGRRILTSPSPSV